MHRHYVYSWNQLATDVAEDPTSPVEVSHREEETGKDVHCVRDCQMKYIGIHGTHRFGKRGIERKVNHHGITTHPHYEYTEKTEYETDVKIRVTFLRYLRFLVIQVKRPTRISFIESHLLMS